jgi:tRNA (adenine37-N6)-methyltransferase
MSAFMELRPGETIIDLPERYDDGIYFLGRIRTPWRSRSECPRQGDPENGPVCRIEVDAPWREALDGVERHHDFQVLYWMDQARRDIVRQSPRSDGNTRGTFSLRSPVRPNPIASSVAKLVGRDDSALLVRGLDCLDGTPLVDIKPVICDHA